jgi:TonB-dependent starch-binding outer membrane protein SusC
MQKALVCRSGTVVAGAGRRMILRRCPQTHQRFCMHLLTVLAALFLFSMSGYGQGITLQFQKTPLPKVFAAISVQTHYQFVYAKDEMAAAKAVTIRLEHADIKQVMDACMKEQPFTYQIKEPYIILQRKETVGNGKIPIGSEPLAEEVLKGRVINEDGEGIAGATVSLSGGSIATASNDAGEWTLRYTGKFSSLTISCVGYVSRTIALNGQAFITAQLQRSISSLDETVVVAYGQTTQRMNTGNVGKVSREEINKQPVGNVLTALEGRIPGLEVIQSSGVPGASVKIQLRGINSLLQGTAPLFIIDGVPFGPGNDPVNQVTNAAGTGGSSGISPFNSLNPADIESIEVLKDADATAIYGSRGANGVILITTRKGKTGPMQCQLNIYTGISRTTRSMDFLNTADYARLRRKAFEADGGLPDINTAPDLLAWDTSRYTDFKKLFTGGRAIVNDAQLSISGGTVYTRYFIGAGYRRESTVFPGNGYDQRGSLHINLTNRSANSRFQSTLSAGTSINANKLLREDLSGYMNLPPNMLLYDSSGNLNWGEGGVTFRSMSLENPLAQLKRSYRGHFKNILANELLEYRFANGLTVKSSFGYNAFLTDEVSLYPQASIDPNSGGTAFSNFANSTLESWIIEPQLTYRKRIYKGTMNLLLGSTWQEQQQKAIYINGENYSNDILLESINAAGKITASNSQRQYKYNAVFGRVNYDWMDKYIINASMRRDGSSRFGPGRRFANFGAVGMAWLFNKESWFDTSKVISYGKLRASYGAAGNDQIGDYQFYDTWGNAYTQYQSVTGLIPSRLYNPDYGWEVNRKLEAGIDLGFFKDRYLFSLSVFRNRSGNQLINYRLPIQTGFSSIIQNFDAVLQNKGLELTVAVKGNATATINWDCSLNLSITRNTLLAFPGLENSSYAGIYAIGYPITLAKLYDYTGVDEQTGLYTFRKADSSSSNYTSKDKVKLIKRESRFYGGLNAGMSYKQWRLDVFAEFRSQTGLNYLYYLGGAVPAAYYMNQPSIISNYWKQPGDPTDIQRLTATNSSAAYKAANLLKQSSAIYSDASYLRLKNVSLSWDIPAAYCKKAGLAHCRLYWRAQNLFTLTKYKGADPETQNLNALAPLRTQAFGLEIGF